MNRQYKPQFSVKYAPRFTRALRTMVNKICRQWDIPEAEVLRYSFEAAILVASRRGLRSIMAMRPARFAEHKSPLNAMMTIRTTRATAKRCLALRDLNRKYSEAEMLRYCLEAIIPLALERGMAHVMALREAELRRLKPTPR
jgi:hypothetical protein